MMAVTSLSAEKGLWIHPAKPAERYSSSLPECAVTAMAGISLARGMFESLSNSILKRGIHQNVIDTIGLCGIDLDHWLEGFHDTEDSVRNTINTQIG